VTEEEVKTVIIRCFILLSFIQMLYEEIGIRKTDTTCPIYKLQLINRHKPITWNL